MAAATKNPLEIDAAPARKSILLRIMTSLHEASQFFSAPWPRSSSIVAARRQ
jgi:hypothetical protein